MSVRAAVKIAIVLGLTTAAVWQWNPWHKIKHSPGVLVRGEPVQRNVKPSTLPAISGWNLEAVAEYRLTARVLGVRRYPSGFGSDLVPIDVALGWGKMSDQAVLDQFDLSMGNRFFFYEWENQPAIPPDEIMRSAANHHIIAANDDVRKTISYLIPGHIVTLRGYLVNARNGEGRVWNTSLRRDDTGSGACEIFLVQAASAVESVAQEVDAVAAAH